MPKLKREPLEKKVDRIDRDLTTLKADHQEFVEFVQENVAMKSDLEKFATKEDLKQYATKEEMNAGFARVMDVLEEILANQKVCVADRQRTDARLERLEKQHGIAA